MAFTEEKFKRQLAIAELKLDDISELSKSEDKSDIENAYKQIGELITRLDQSKDATTDQLLETDTELEYVKRWALIQKGSIQAFREARVCIRKRLQEAEEREIQIKIERELFIQRAVNEEQTKHRLQQQQEIEEASLRRQKQEEEWYRQKLDYEKQMAINHADQANNTDQIPMSSTLQAVKLQKYTITPFKGDFKDWLRFWNQFTVEVDGSRLSEISKFNYLLELVKDKPREDILGLPHTSEGYQEAKKILVQTYGKDIKVHKALIKELEELSAITSIHKLPEIHDFYNKLARIVRTLNTMDKLTTAQSSVYTLMDKLGPVREILVQKDDDWEQWGLQELVENLRRYVERNPLRVGDDKTMTGRRDDTRYMPGRKREEKLLLGNNGDIKQYRKSRCVYCSSEEHASHGCMKVLDLTTKRDILRRNRMCFNCTGVGHIATNCRSRNCCRNCQGKHHTSICDKTKSTLDVPETTKTEKGLSTGMGHTSTIHATAIAKIGTETVRVMFDTGAGSSYICSDLITKLHLKPVKTEQRCIEQMYGTVRKTVEVYNVTIQSLAIEGFSFDIECVNAEKGILTYLPNPHIADLKRKYSRLRRLEFEEERSADDSLPVHIILGAADYQRIRTTEPLVLGARPDKDPGAEFTMLGWTISGRNTVAARQTEKQFFLRSSQEEFEKLCSLDVLGLQDSNTKESATIHEEFKQQLTRLESGHYATKLPWKEDHVPLPTNKCLSTARLYSTTRKLERIGRLEQYDSIMREQINQGVIEPVPINQTGEVLHYVPHQAVIRDDAETTKLRIVYDCSARANTRCPSLNDCLETGPPLQPLLFDIITRNRMRKFCITGDIQKAFLQIRVHEQDRDALRVLWYNNLQDREVKEYRFTRVIFGATSSPYILGVTLQKHVEEYKHEYPATAQSLLEDTYVDDIQGGGDTESDVVTFKEESTKLLSEGGFSLHKWHSNVSHLDSEANNSDSTEAVRDKSNETKILGIPWNKKEDTLMIHFEPCLKSSEPITKRKMVADINSIFDILGWCSPVTITAKLIFSEVCQLQLHWDEEVPDAIKQKWWSWVNSLRRTPTITIPRCVFTNQPTHFEMHGFADASKVAVCAAIYIIAYQDSVPVSQNLLAAKSRIAPKHLSIPRLELVAAHTLAKLQSNVIKGLSKVPITDCYSWVDSITVLYWLSNHGEWSTFVRNRVEKIRYLIDSKWRYMPTGQNPSDMGTRGLAPNRLGEMWFKGPNWLSNEENRPVQPEIIESEGVQSERKRTKGARESEVMFLLEDRTHYDLKAWTGELLSKFNFWKLLRITSYVKRFIDRCRGIKRVGPLGLSEIKESERVWIQITQQTNDMTADVTLVTDQDNIQRCSGRVQGYNPIFIPRKSALARRIIEHCHLQTLHGGVAATMSKVREKYWIPKLRTLVKSIRYECHYCTKYRAKVLDNPATSALPTFRTKFTDPFDVTGVDFAGPLLYRSERCEPNKAYIALFTCASTRAVHLKLCRDLTVTEFKRGLREFVARRGSPSLMVSDNAKTFIATKRWLSTLQEDEDLFNYLAKRNIEWKFNLSRSPWWGGFFERLIGIMKRSLSKAVGRALLKFEELEDVLLDVETFMNNRPLCYIEEEFEQVVITPNLLLRGQPARFLEDNINEVEDSRDAVSKRMKFLITCRENIRKRWVNEYLHALQERHTKRSETRDQEIPGKNAIVLLKDTSKNRANWKIGRIVDTIVGRDGVIRGYKIRTGSGYVVERPLQLVCDLEISGTDDTTVCDSNVESEVETVIDNVSSASKGEDGNSASNGLRRTSRRAKTEAVDRLVGIVANEIEED